MLFQLTLIEKPTYLHAIVEGDNTIENVKGYFEALVRECESRNCFRLLIEERLKGPRLGPTEVYNVIAGGAERFRGRFEEIAYVDVEREGNLMQYAEGIAADRDFPLMMFSGVAEAERWLMRERE
jgi:hypothetical protein